MGLGLCRTCLGIKLDEWPPSLLPPPAEDPSEDLELRSSEEVIAADLSIDTCLRRLG